MMAACLEPLGWDGFVDLPVGTGQLEGKGDSGVKRVAHGRGRGYHGAKAAIFDQGGRFLGVGRSEYGVRRVRPGWAEQDPEN